MHILLNDTIDTINEDEVMRLIATLPDWRREQALRFKHLSGKRECTMAYILLQKGLQEIYGINEPPHFIIGEHGKPSLMEHPNIHFNLSHCKLAILCTLDNRPIGVDIERIREAKPSLVEYTMNTEESEQIFTSDNPNLAFTQLWTAKEAVVKLTGKGIQDSLQSLLAEAVQWGINISTHTNSHKGYAYSIATWK